MTVPASHRRDTSIKYVYNMRQLQRQMYSFVQACIPKRQRYIVGNPLMDAVSEAYESALLANRTYPNDPDSCRQRMMYLNKVLECTVRIISKLDLWADIGQKQSHGDYLRFLEICEEEVRLVNGMLAKCRNQLARMDQEAIGAGTC